MEFRSILSISSNNNDSSSNQIDQKKRANKQKHERTRYEPQMNAKNSHYKN